MTLGFFHGFYRSRRYNNLNDVSVSKCTKSFHKYTVTTVITHYNISLSKCGFSFVPISLSSFFTLYINIHSFTRTKTHTTCVILHILNHLNFYNILFFVDWIKFHLRMHVGDHQLSTRKSEDFVSPFSSTLYACVNLLYFMHTSSSFFVDGGQSFFFNKVSV